MMRAIVGIIVAILFGGSAQAQQVVHPLNAPLAPYTTGHIVTFCGIQQTCDTPILPPAQGGTGVNNGTNTLTLGGNLSTAKLLAIADMNVTNDVSYVPSPGNLGHESLSALIDAVFGSAQGDILYRDTALWMVLAPGIAGQSFQTGGVAANPLYASMRQILGGGSSATQAANLTRYTPVSGNSSANASTEPPVEQLAPLPGTFRNFYAQVAAAPGTGNSVVFTLRINAAAPVSGPTCTISAAATTCNDTTDTATITTGQPYDIQVVTSTSATATGGVSTGIEFDNP